MIWCSMEVARQMARIDRHVRAMQQARIARAWKVIVLGAIWGGAFTLIKVLVDDGLSPAEIAVARLALGAAAVIAFQLARGAFRWPARGLLLPIAIVAAGDTVAPYLLVGWAEGRIASGAAAVLISAMPLFTALFAAGFVREEAVRPSGLVGIGVGFLGVMTLVGPPAPLVHSGGSGELAVVGAAASYGAASLYARRLLRHIDAANFTAIKLATGALLAAVATLIARDGAGFAAIGGDSIAALVTLGALCTGVSFVLYFRTVASAGSVAGSTVTYVIPAFGLLFGALFLDESIAPRTFAGMALIARGVAAVTYAWALEALLARLRARTTLACA
jgi:drug/metabolite transporter (DMT)-like permease